METPTKITLSPQELQLVTNTEWILTKQEIIHKVYCLLGERCSKMKGLIENEKPPLPDAVLFTEPKIYKGEQYLKLPYVMLDYPRCFGPSDIFAIRTMFWWGNFFSITLQLSGVYKNMYEDSILKNQHLLQKRGYYYCINEDQWQHHFDAGNYSKIDDMGTAELGKRMGGSAFIKIARPFALQQWNEMPELLEQSFLEILQLLRP
jgi:hypothetical protein